MLKTDTFLVNAKHPRFTSSEILTDSALQHVLNGEGEPSYRGGHRFSSTVTGKTVFPEDWSDSDIEAALRATLEHPAKVVVRTQFVLFFGLVNEVVIEIKIELTKQGPKMRHAFPRSGVGVYRNDPSARTALPLDLSELES